jgi:hypothetical protein
MLSGRLQDGQVLPNYSKISQEVYGYPDIPIALKDTGAFQAGIFVEIQGDKILTDSTDGKTDMLEEKYGKLNGSSVFGLGSSGFKGEYLDILQPVLVKEFKKATGL